MRNATIVIVGCILTILSIFLWVAHIFPFHNTPLDTAERREFKQLRIGKQSFEVVLSKTTEQITQGLSDRDSIGAEGMLFILPYKQRTSFWMYHMRFPLDFIWIEDGAVVDLHENVPGASTSTPENEVPIITPDHDVEWVLEVPAGFIQAKGITEGLPVTLDQVSEVRPWH